MKNVYKRIFICLVIGLLSFFCFSKVILYIFDGQDDIDNKKVESLLKAYKNNITLNLKEKYNYTDDLKTALILNNYSIEALDDTAKKVLKNDACMYISILEKHNVSAFFSKSATKNMIGTQMKNLNYSYSLAESVKGLVVEGPFKDSVSNKEVFLIINPIYKNGNYWGEVAIALDSKKVIDDFNLKQLKSAGFEYELWRVDLNDGSKSTIEISTQDFDFSKSQEIKFKFPTVWTLSIINENGFSSKNLIFIIHIIFLIFSVLIAGIVFIYLGKKSVDCELREQKLRDLETGVWNKKGLLIKLKEILQKNPDEVVLLYISITNYSRFAPILNCDEKKEYIEHIVQTLENYITSSHFVARIGEESFVLAFKEKCGKNELLSIEKGISLELLRKINVRNQEIFLTIGYGAAMSIDDGKDAEKLLLAAIDDYERRFPSIAPIRDFTKKCEDMLDEKKQIVFGEYSDLDINRLARVIYKYYRKVQRIMYKDYSIDVGNRRGYIRDIEVLTDYNSKRKLDLFLIDICNFGKFNELFSIEIGDLVLKEVTNNLRKVFPDYLYRINGDVFLGISLNKESYLSVLDKIEDIFSNSLNIKDLFLDVKCNIGICQYPSHGKDAYELLEKAQIALGYVKESTQNHVQVYNDELTNIIYHENNIIKRIKQSIEEQTLEVWYQPIFNVEKNCYIKAEALVRLKDEEGNYYSALDVINCAEKNGLIKDVGLYVLQQSCKVTKIIKDKNMKFEQMHVNLSVQQIIHKDCANDILECIKNCELDTKYISVEVTESVFMETFEVATMTLDKLKKEGIGINLDDFGSGFSSLNYLANLPIENLKIDKGLVKQIKFSSKQYELMKAIVQMAKINNMDIVAEGVETEETLNLVVSAGVNLIQGYYFSKPLNENKFIELMTQND
ncbi:EAL domain-containing protein [Clostridioides difficile]